MKRPLSADDLRLWSTIAATVHPLPGRHAPAPVSDPGLPSPKPVDILPPPLAHAPPRDLHAIEPKRFRRISRDREGIGARVDLHGLDQDRARAKLDAFLVQAWREGQRAVLVITGKGTRGDGVLRRHAPEWLAAAHLREVVAGISEAHRKHGGEGALYVALKRRPRA